MVKIKKLWNILIISFLIVLLVSTPVSAGFWNSLKKFFKTSGDDIVKKYGDDVIKKSDDVTKKSDDIAKKYGDDVIKKSDDLTKEERIVYNKAKGLKWEKYVEDYLCGSMSGKKCIYSLQEMPDYKIKSYNNYLKVGSGWKDYTIVGGKNTKEFINNNKDTLLKWEYKYTYNLNREPDFLEIIRDGGGKKIEKIVLLDAKAGEGGINLAQKADYLDFCKKTKVSCEVKYIMPQSETAGVRGAVDLVCLGANVLFPVPDPVDGLCWLTIFNGKW